MELEIAKHALAMLQVGQKATKKVPGVVGRRLEVLCSKFSEANDENQLHAALILAHVR
jgi:hypothetical protein